MNTNLGFGKSASEYLSFMDACSITNSNSTRDTLAKWLNEYKKYGHTPHLDASGCDTTNRKVDFGGHIYTAGVPLGEIIRNGVMTLPGYYADTLSHNGVDFDFGIDTMCLDTAGFTWETRVREPDSTVHPNLGASMWLWLGGNAAPSKLILMSVSKIDGRGVGVCTDEDNGSTCSDDNVPGQHLNDWRVIKFQFRGRNFRYYIDDTLLAQRTLYAPMSKLWNWSFSMFSKYGAVDYVKVSDTAGNVLYREDFDDAHILPQISNRARCVDCETRFTEYYNGRNGSGAFLRCHRFYL